MDVRRAADEHRASEERAPAFRSAHQAARLENEFRSLQPDSVLELLPSTCFFVQMSATSHNEHDS